MEVAKQFWTSTLGSSARHQKRHRPMCLWRIPTPTCYRSRHNGKMPTRAVLELEEVSIWLVTPSCTIPCLITMSPSTTNKTCRPTQVICTTHETKQNLFKKATMLKRLSNSRTVIPVKTLVRSCDHLILDLSKTNTCWGGLMRRQESTENWWLR